MIGQIKVDLQKNELAQKKRRRWRTHSEQDPIRIKLEVTVGSDAGVLLVDAWHGKSKVGKATIEYAQEKGRVKHRAGP